jgi:hypothetical protein
MDDESPFCCETQAYLVRHGYFVRLDRKRRGLAVQDPKREKRYFILSYCPMCGTPLGGKATPPPPGQLVPREGPALSANLAVVIHDDPVTTRAFVLELGEKVFGLDASRAEAVTQEVESSGRARVVVLPG